MKKNKLNKAKPEYNESGLPIWAQDKLMRLRQEISSLQALKKMHLILSEKDREWFVLRGPYTDDNREHIKLWILNRDDPLPVCTLYKGDLLFVGRSSK